MSSLLQHHGTVRGGKVELLCYLCTKTKYGSLTVPVEEDRKGRPILYRFWRKPAGSWGAWAVFRYFGEKQVPDLSVPIRVEELPKGAERLTEAEAEKYWSS